MGSALSSQGAQLSGARALVSPDRGSSGLRANLSAALARKLVGAGPGGRRSLLATKNTVASKLLLPPGLSRWAAEYHRTVKDELRAAVVGTVSPPTPVFMRRASPRPASTMLFRTPPLTLPPPPPRCTPPHHHPHP